MRCLDNICNKERMDDKFMSKIGFIGAGNMATAIIKGLIANGIKRCNDINVYDIDEMKLQEIEKFGVKAVKSSQELVNKSDVIVLAIKPQVYGYVLEEISAFTEVNKVFVSIAAGISTEYVKKALKKDCTVVRVMPNTPLLLGKGSTAMCKPDNIDEEIFKTIYNMFALSGTVEIIPENQMNTIIAVNGSSPAYIYLFAKAMVDYAKENGIDADVALNLTCAAFEGSAEMLRSSGDTPDILIKKVSSPGGTTLKALESLENDDFYNSVKRAMDACTKRANELGK